MKKILSILWSGGVMIDLECLFTGEVMLWQAGTNG
jgi:hypothetical protein